MKGLLLILLMLVSSSAWAAKAADKNLEAKLQSPSQRARSCRFEAKVRQSECLSTPGGYAECFSEVLTRYETCCSDGRVVCPDLKF